jgi:hypothetical protein
MSRNLVAFNMTGGLGNQLFSYAAGLALARRLDGDLHFDLRSYENAGSRKLELQAFGLELRRWRPRWWKVERLARQTTGGLWRPGPERHYQSADFDPVFFTVQRPCFMMGYFQSWRYFAAVDQQVRSAFDTDKLDLPRIGEWERRISAAECPVMVHVRRGDYRSAPDIFTLFDVEYYDRARARLENSGPRPTYFLFSDEMREATAMLSHWPNLVPLAGFDTLEDFRLMSLGRHFIIPNSTFSWWAAWLGRANDKVVVVPNSWFGPGYVGKVDLDARLPPEWIRV